MDTSDSPLFAVGEVYRWKETAKLSLRLTYSVTDLLAEVSHLCEQNGLQFSDGIDSVLVEIEKILSKIKETQTLPIAELLRRPATQLRPSDDSYHGDDSDEELPKP